MDYSKEYRYSCKPARRGCFPIQLNSLSFIARITNLPMVVPKCCLRVSSLHGIFQTTRYSQTNEYAEDGNCIKILKKLQGLYNLHWYPWNRLIRICSDSREKAILIQASVAEIVRRANQANSPHARAQSILKLNTSDQYVPHESFVPITYHSRSDYWTYGSRTRRFDQINRMQPFFSVESLLLCRMAFNRWHWGLLSSHFNDYYRLDDPQFSLNFRCYNFSSAV